jgi:hypothetical protein
MRIRRCKIVIVDVIVDKSRRSLWRARLPVSDKGTGGLHGKNRSGAQVVAKARKCDEIMRKSDEANRSLERRNERQIAINRVITGDPAKWQPDRPCYRC